MFRSIILALFIVLQRPEGCAQARKGLSDEALLDTIQKTTFAYFWDFGHPVSGLARERSNRAFDYGDEVVTTGGTGFGIMAVIVAVNRGWITRTQAVERLLKMTRFLLKSNSYHGVFPHWLNGETGQTIPFSRKDDGGDLVETAYLIQGLISAQQYFDRPNDQETELRSRIHQIRNEVEWNWHVRPNNDGLYWHWSPNNGWAMNHPIRGWNECLIVYILAASSTRYAIEPEVYHKGWANSDFFYNGKEYYGINLPLGFDYGGPLFFAHYSFLGLDPRGLRDRYADYWQQNVAHVAINHAHCVANPHGFKGYSSKCWGLTASDSPKGYNAHAPNNDLGVISPTAALSSMPYLPQESLSAARYFFEELGDILWTPYGFRDAFSPDGKWVAQSHLAIDQGPIIVMIENYRTGLLWKLFMSDNEVQRGLKRLGFESPSLGH